MDLKELQNGVDPDKHWYYQTKKICLFKFFKEKIVSCQKRVIIIDVGAGSGFFSVELYKFYSEYIDKVLLVDLYYTEQEVLETKDSVVEKLNMVPSKINNAFIIMMDVIEHIEDDSSFIEDLLLRIEGENYFYITVPAFQFLWSGHDVFLGHYRRYTLPQLRLLLQSERICIDNIFYQYALIFPIVLTLRKIMRKSKRPKNDLKPVSSSSNALLKKILGIEMRIARFNKLFGLTCSAEGRFLEDDF